MADLCFVTRKYTGQDWGTVDAVNRIILLKQEVYPNNIDTIIFPYPIDVNSVVVGVKSFYLSKTNHSHTRILSWGIENAAEVDNTTTPGQGKVSIKPYLQAEGHYPDGGVLLAAGSILELSIIVQQLSS